jgi:DNA-directed RNA polymerase subunit M/transcription elongation factor TFIIS
VVEWIELECSACDWHSLCGPTQMLQWLRTAGMVRRDAAPDVELLPELLKSAAPKLKCPKCLAPGLLAKEPPEEADDEEWGMARKCAACQQAIPRERLEVFPRAELCVACQGKSDRGESSDAPEYCPRCGNIMALRQARQGVTRYVMACPSCRS